MATQSGVPLPTGKRWVQRHKGVWAGGMWLQQLWGVSTRRKGKQCSSYLASKQILLCYCFIRDPVKMQTVTQEVWVEPGPLSYQRVLGDALLLAHRARFQVARLLSWDKRLWTFWPFSPFLCSHLSFDCPNFQTEQRASRKSARKSGKPDHQPTPWHMTLPFICWIYLIGDISMCETLQFYHPWNEHVGLGLWRPLWVWQFSVWRKWPGGDEFANLARQNSVFSLAILRILSHFLSSFCRGNLCIQDTWPRAALWGRGAQQDIRRGPAPGQEPHRLWAAEGVHVHHPGLRLWRRAPGDSLEEVTQVSSLTELSGPPSTLANSSLFMHCSSDMCTQWSHHAAPACSTACQFPRPLQASAPAAFYT